MVTVLEDEEVRLLALGRAIRPAQEIVRRYVPEGRTLVDELLEEALELKPRPALTPHEV